MVVGTADFFVACLDWRPGGCGGHAIRLARDYRCWLVQDLDFIVVAPIMGLVLAFSFMVAIFWLLRDKPPQKIDVWFRKLQLLSAAAYSLGHGGNDAQKTMGIVASALSGRTF